MTSRTADELVVDGRPVRVTSPQRVLWPETGTTKAELIAYYLRVADVMLPHIAGHPVTLHRFPEGVGGPHFFQTRTPPHPDWVRTTTLHYPSTGKTFETPVLDDAAALVWAANLAAIEIHPFLSRADDFDSPRWLVVDLDPGPPATIVDAAAVALDAREELAVLDLPTAVKTSGGKGLHVYARLPAGLTYDDSKRIARVLAGDLAHRRPQLVVTTMTKSRRAGRVFVDWSQNDAGKSTVAPYSVRGFARPTVSTPLSWSEVEAVARTRDVRALWPSPEEVVARLNTYGDLFAGVL